MQLDTHHAEQIESSTQRKHCRRRTHHKVSTIASRYGSRALTVARLRRQAGAGVQAATTGMVQRKGTCTTASRQGYQAGTTSWHNKLAQHAGTASGHDKLTRLAGRASWLGKLARQADIASRYHLQVDNTSRATVRRYSPWNLQAGSISSSHRQ